MRYKCIYIFYSEFTYVVHLEAINCLLVLLSVQLFSQTAAEYSSVYRIAMHAHLNQHAPTMVCTLLHNFIQQEHAPPGLLTQQSGGSIVFSIAGKYDNITRCGRFILQSVNTKRCFSWIVERNKNGHRQWFEKYTGRT